MNESTLIIELVGIYDNLDDQAPLLNHSATALGLTISILALTWLCVGFRIYTRVLILHSPGWDDVLVVLFLISGTVCSLSVVIAMHHGLGKHFLTLSPDDIAMYTKLLWLSNATYCMSTALIKLSLLFQYLRLFQDGSVSKRLCLPLIVITMLWGIAFSIIAWFPCFPVGMVPDPTTGHCYGFYSAKALTFYRTYVYHSASNMALDLIVLLTPLPLYFRENTPRRTKLGLLALFIMGSIVTSLSVGRLVNIVEYKGGTYPTLDPTWYGTNMSMFALFEVDAASICASVPVFWPILTAKLDKIFVTREVKIERSDRYSTMEDDEFELRDAADSYSGKKSGATLTGEENMPGVSGGKGAHYMDEFIASQVDPFRGKFGVEAEVLVTK